MGREGCVTDANLIRRNPRLEYHQYKQILPECWRKRDNNSD